MPAQTVIKLRRDTAANWSSVNPVLASGEPGIETDTGKLKFGDGVTAWNSLIYASGGASVDVSDTPPADPDPNSLWWESDTGTLFIYYDNYWVEAVTGVVGPQGPIGLTGDPGIVAQTEAPTDTTILWLDTDEPGDAVLPTGGTAGQVLAKVDSADYNTEWTTLTASDISDVTATAAELNILDGATVTTSELNTLDGITTTAAALNTIDDGTAGYTALSKGTAGITYQPVSHNYIINGAFDVAQRGTNFTDVTFTYTLDRWEQGRGGFDTGLSVSRVSATGLNDIRYAMRVQRASGNTSTQNIRSAYILETADSIPLAGKAVTLSFYARKGADWSATTLDVALISGTGTDEGDIASADTFTTGNATVVTSSPTLTTSWQRFTFTGTVSTSATQLAIRIRNDNTGTAGTNDYYEITGVQLEAGSVATPFKRHAPSLQGELAACQRYYWRRTYTNAQPVCTAGAFSTTIAMGQVDYPEMRTTPSLSASGTYQVVPGNITVTLSNFVAGNTSARFDATGSGFTAKDAFSLRSTSNSSYFEISAEL